LLIPDFPWSWLLVQVGYNVIDGVRVGKHPRNVGLPVTDHALFVDDDHRTVAGPAFLIPQSIGLGRLAPGMEVGQLGVGQSAQCRAPSAVSGNGVATDTQYLGIAILELLVFLSERGSLRGSTRGEIENVERKDDGLLSSVIGQGNVPIGGRKLEIGRYIANFCRHTPAFIY